MLFQRILQGLIFAVCRLLELQSRWLRHSNRRLLKELWPHPLPSIFPLVSVCDRGFPPFCTARGAPKASASFGIGHVQAHQNHHQPKYIFFLLHPLLLIATPLLSRAPTGSEYHCFLLALTKSQRMQWLFFHLARGRRASSLSTAKRIYFYPFCSKMIATFISGGPIRRRRCTLTESLTRPAWV
jgi:hypothetical protein